MPISYGMFSPGEQGIDSGPNKRQWVDLGAHTDACMVRPETCGAAGGAISFWIKFIDCPNNGGIISSRGTGRRGLLFHCRPTNIVYAIKMLNFTLFW